MQISRSGTIRSQTGSAEHFSGHVRIDDRFVTTAPARNSIATVTFEPGARTAWHSHPLGQILIVVSGLGWVQVAGGPREEVRPGDIVWFLPHEKHWHGAAATSPMCHIAIVEALDGKSAEWMEKVSEHEYHGSEPFSRS